jgi:hypothetical protein
MSDLYCGRVRVSPDVMLPIIDCRKWRVVGGKPECALERDVNGCAACEVRESRQGNLLDPPILGREPRRPQERPRGQTASDTPPAEPERMRGLGDAVAHATKLIGIKPCGGCQSRRALLNRLVPFGGQESPVGESEGAAPPQTPPEAPNA